jgi:hypothetical protein
MTKFEEFYKQLLEAAKGKNACEPEYKRALTCTNKTDLLQIIKDNFNWLYNNKIINKDFLLSFYSNAELNEQLIFTDKENDINLKTNSTVILLGSSHNTITSRGSSQNTITSRGSSHNTITSRDSSQNTITSRDSSQNTIETWGSSQNTITSWGSSQNTITSRSSSQNTITSWGSSQNTITSMSNESILIDLTKKEVHLAKNAYNVIYH